MFPNNSKEMHRQYLNIVLILIHFSNDSLVLHLMPHFYGENIQDLSCLKYTLALDSHVFHSQSCFPINSFLVCTIPPPYDHALRCPHIFGRHPLDEFFKAGFIFVERLEAVAVSSKDDGIAGYDQALVAVEGECAGNWPQLGFLVADQDDFPIQFDELDQAASDEVVQALQGLVRILYIGFLDGAAGGVDFDGFHVVLLLDPFVIFGYWRRHGAVSLMPGISGIVPRTPV